MSLVKKVEELNQNFSPNACCGILLEIARQLENLQQPIKVEKKECLPVVSAKKKTNK